MSGIYGFSYRTLDSDLAADALAGLEYWNRIYGRKANASKLLDRSGLGCQIEHFSDAFAHSEPILNCGNGFAVVDALLFNRDELFELLRLDPADKLSDEALLLRLIQEKGFDSLRHVNGDFAGAIFDPEAKIWTLFRDHMGVRPLYYYFDDDLIAFSTDIRGLASLPNTDLSINELQMYTALSGDNPLTLTGTEFSRIHCVRPASILQLRMTASGVETEEHIYWHLGANKIRLDSDEAYQAELRRLVTDSVNRRCDAISGLLGAELSGGLDSSTIDILINRHGREARFYSWSLDPKIHPIVDEQDERNIIKDICEQEHIECHFRVHQDIFSFQSKGEWLIPYYLDTPAMSYGSSWLKSQGANVVFTGHGGDEGISHRGRQYELWHAGEYLSYFRLHKENLRERPLCNLRAIYAGLSDAWIDTRNNKQRLKIETPFAQIFAPDYYQRMLARFRPLPFTFNYDPKTFIMQGGTRPRMDNAAYHGAVNGVRYLFPYVDYRVMDFAVSIPRSQFFTPSQNRAVFRSAFRDIYPDSLRQFAQKRTVSYQSIPDSPKQNENYQNTITRLLERLEPDFWSAYLNLENLESVLRSHDGASGGIRSVDTLTAILSRYLRVREMQNQAKNWRQHESEA